MSYEMYTKALAVTPHDTNAQTVYDALYVGVAGNVNGTLRNDSSAVVFTGMLAGTLYPFSFKLIKSTSTTATNMVILDSGKTYS
jgi:hypothetical protein